MSFGEIMDTDQLESGGSMSEWDDNTLTQP